MGNQSNANDNDWGWQESPQKEMSTSKSYHNQFSNSSGAGTVNTSTSLKNTAADGGDDWSGFDSYQDSATSYQNSTPLTTTNTAAAVSNKNLKLASTTQKLSEGFESLDVKNVKPTKPIANKTDEDDAWDLLMK